MSADVAIQKCMSLTNPVSFFLYAGAGSGKTRSLVGALDNLRNNDENRRCLLLRGQRVAVITYTNAACDEIKRRLAFDLLIEVSTIHAFAWSLICGFNADIREWIRIKLTEDIAELEVAFAKGKPGTKISKERQLSIESKKKRLAGLNSIQKFIYSPTGENRTRDSLNHAEVISITSDFLNQKNKLQDLLVNRHPILLVDESQDTNRHLMSALLVVQKANHGCFCLGLFGDTMQRIYSDGLPQLEKVIPENWEKPVKTTNHRCPQRVLRLINKIRLAVDDHQQISPEGKEEGFVRLFIASATADPATVENTVAKRMAQICGDGLWHSEGYKALILEHHMAAVRMGFFQMFDPLYKQDRLKTGLLDGTLSGVHFFASDVLPLVLASRRGDAFAVARAVRQNSPLLSAKGLKLAPDQRQQLKDASESVSKLMQVWNGAKNPEFLDVARCITATGLFNVPEAVDLAAKSEEPTENLVEDVEETNEEFNAWRSFLHTPFEQISQYASYVGKTSQFDTHQGVKGLEFPRVMVIMNDEEAKGFAFSYDKLFGAKEKSTADIKNEKEGSETSIDRTRRLFYVTCSRAESSLALVAYSANPEAVQRQALTDGWFEEHEIETI